MDAAGLRHLPCCRVGAAGHPLHLATCYGEAAIAAQSGPGAQWEMMHRVPTRAAGLAPATRLSRLGLPHRLEPHSVRARRRAIRIPVLQPAGLSPIQTRAGRAPGPGRVDRLRVQVRQSSQGGRGWRKPHWTGNLKKGLTGTSGP